MYAWDLNGKLWNTAPIEEYFLPLKFLETQVLPSKTIMISFAFLNCIYFLLQLIEASIEETSTFSSHASNLLMRTFCTNILSLFNAFHGVKMKAEQVPTTTLVTYQTWMDLLVARVGGNTKRGINRRGFARWLFTVEPRVFRSPPSGYS